MIKFGYYGLFLQKSQECGIILPMKTKNQNGFSLIEVMVGVAVFALVFVGIYSGIQMVLKVVYQSRLRIIETGVLDEQIEIIRNLPFADIGIVNGSPAGILQRIATTTRNGIDFSITRTIRNIDDNYDGVIGGIPNDTSPADYKLAEVEIICARCNQREPARLSTFIAPRNLEGDPTHGALFIEVFDANADPVPGATVHVVATSTNPAIDLTDTTDNEGMLRIVDLGAGMDAYSLTVSKSGYTTDQTLNRTVNNPNPVKLPASVTAQSVTEISFSIDRVSSLGISTINNACVPVAGVSMNAIGTKIIGTEPDVFKINQTITTNSSGEYTLANLEWDSYGLRPSSYDLLGSIPALPINLAPGVEQPVQLILGANTVNSLLVQVKDSITGQPVPSAIVRVSATGYNQNKTTGVGYIQQTDWSGGSGQLDFTNETKYWADDGKMEISDPAGDVKLKKVGQQYVSDAYLESSIFDLGVAATMVDLIWEPLAQPQESGAGSARFQIVVSSTSTPEAWDYVGPDNTANTYFDEQNFSLANIPPGNRYLRYKMFLRTANVDYTPTVSHLNITYTTSCTPPGQAYFGNLANQEYTVEVSKSGYQTSTQTVAASGDVIMEIELTAS